MHRAGWTHGPTAEPHATRRSALNARRRVWRHILPRAAPTADHGRARGNRQMSSSIAGVHSSGCRTTRRQRSARLRICAWRHGNQRYARRARLMAIHSAALVAQLPAQTASTPARSIRQQVTWTGHRISAGPRGTPAIGSVLPLFGLEDTLNRPSIRRLRRSFDVPEEETGPQRQRPLRSSIQPADHIAGACRAFGKHGPPPLPCPALPSPRCTTNLRTDSDEKRGAAAPLVCSSCQRAMIRSSQSRPAS